ncbi:hypothetical protein [Yinghuangia soli]|uniref:PknH-like extracellular domain-containing protein n=1 Tax=Yinghuangia soli TaxID=2908204 RepID=A0AA41U751_9ACTN|nr:hypothetical protein [Yinghuangia soli]MCF2533702.1 hypothetical protein [Yinghuangia soli]
MRSTRRLVVAAAVVPLILAVGACGSDDKKDSKTEGAAATSTAGSGGNGDSKAPEGGTGGGSAKELPASELAKVLLAQADVPSGWTVDESTETTENEPGKAGDAKCQPLVDLMSSTGTAKPSARAEVDVSDDAKQDFSYTIELQSFGSRAASLFAAAKKAAESCPTFTVATSEGTGTYKVAKGQTPKAGGDESLGLRLEVEAAGQVFPLPVSVVRVGGIIVSAASYDTSGDDKIGQIPDEILKLQVDKAKAAQK